MNKTITDQGARLSEPQASTTKKIRGRICELEWEALKILLSQIEPETPFDAQFLSSLDEIAASARKVRLSMRQWHTLARMAWDNGAHQPMVCIYNFDEA
jgi:hypothetical protein